MCCCVAVQVRDHGKRADNLREKHEDKGEELSQMTSRHVKLDAAYKEEREVMNKELTRQVSEVEDIELELRRTCARVRACECASVRVRAAANGGGGSGGKGGYCGCCCCCCCCLC